MVSLKLTNADAVYLQEILDLWIEGYHDSKAEIERDPTIDSPEEMLASIYGADRDIEDAMRIRSRLNKELSGTKTG